MPKTSTGQGHSENTQLKLKNYQYFLGFLWPAARGVMKHNWASDCLHLIDFNSRPGRTDEYGEGSPLIALREAQAKGFSDREVSALFIDNSKDATQNLQQNLVQFESPNWNLSVENGDNSTFTEFIIEKIRKESRGKSPLGLIYADPNGYNDAPLQSILDISKEFSTLDVLIHISATTVKRQVNARAVEGISLLDIEEFIRDVKKTECFVRRPYGTFQWTLIYLTNWGKAPALEKIDFHKNTSPQGKKIFERLTMTAAEMREKEERESGQLRLDLE